MNLSVINLAQANQQELHSLSNIYPQLNYRQGPILELFPQLRESVAQTLISLGILLMAQGSAPSRALINFPQNSWQCH